MRTPDVWRPEVCPPRSPQDHGSKSEEICTANAPPNEGCSGGSYFFRRRRSATRAANLFGFDLDLPSHVRNNHAVTVDCGRLHWAEANPTEPSVSREELLIGIHADVQRAFDSWAASGRWTPLQLDTARRLLVDKMKPARIAKAEGTSRAAISLRIKTLCKKDQRLNDWWLILRSNAHSNSAPSPRRRCNSRRLEQWAEVVVVKDDFGCPQTTVQLRTGTTRTTITARREVLPIAVIDGLARLKAALAAGLGGTNRPLDVYIRSDMMSNTADLDMLTLITAGPGHMLQHAKANGLLITLVGVRVHFFGSVTDGIPLDVKRSLCSFWRDYFTLTGADLVAFSTRELLKGEVPSAVTLAVRGGCTLPVVTK